MKHLILGTAGHIDHGKTSLVRALTGIDTDRLPEEKARGITIELGFAHLSLPGDIQLGIVDVPGHERFVRTMVAGAGGMDLVMLVVAADEGIMPQTREHLDICQLLGVKRGLVALTKTDMVDGEWLAMAAEEVKDYLRGTFLEEAAVVPVSSRYGTGLDALRKELGRLAAEVEEKKGTGHFRLPVDRVFTVAGFGTVVTGTLLSGELRVGEEVEILPARLQGRLRGLQVHGTKGEKATAGQRVAANIQGVDHTDVHRGDVVAPRGVFLPTQTVDVHMKYLSAAPGDLRHRRFVRLHSATYEVPAQVILLDRDVLAPGEEAFVQLRLKSPALLLPGDAFVLRNASPPATIGGGRVLDPAPPRRRRRSADALSLLAALHEGNDAERITQLTAQSLLSGISLEELALRTGFTHKRLELAFAPLLGSGTLVQVVRDPRIFLARPAFDQMKDLLLLAIRAYLQANPLKGGMGKEELKAHLPRRGDVRFFGSLLASLEKDGQVVVERDLVKLPGDSRPVSSVKHPLLLDRLEKMLQDGGAEPPTVKELSDALKTREKDTLDHLHVLVRDHRVVKVKNDLFYAPQHLDRLKEMLASHLRSKGEISPGEFRDLSGLSRKFMIPLLEYFDQEKLTIRIGDKRRLRKKQE